jgi:hypothetical protein
VSVNVTFSAVPARQRPWSFDVDGNLFRLVSEANRIKLAHVFDPLLATHTSIDPVPHQMTAIYGEMHTRQPLPFLLADDPGAGQAARRFPEDGVFIA